MNRYANDILGFDIRREIQGIYESTRILQGIQDGAIPLTEKEFEEAGNYAIIKLSSIYSNQPEYLSEACDMIRAGRGKVTQQLKEIIARKGGGTNDESGPIEDSKMDTQNVKKKRPTIPDCLKDR